MTHADLAGFEVPVEDSISVDYRGYQVHACDVWCQGIALLESLKILEGFDLTALGHNSPQYVHTVAETLNLAFADREAYVGDPRFVKVPREALLSAAYAARQRARIMPERAFGEMPEPGDPESKAFYGAGVRKQAYAAPRGKDIRLSPDTIYGCVVEEMRKIGHDVDVWPAYPASNASVRGQSRSADGSAPRRSRSAARGLRAGVVSAG